MNNLLKFKLLFLLLQMQFSVVSAMTEPMVDQKKSEPEYSFVTLISNARVGGGELVIFVKKITARYLVTFDRKMRCDIFDIQDHYKKIKAPSGPKVSYAPDNIFCITDDDKQTLLVGYYRKKGFLYITKLDEDLCSWEVFKMTSPFSFGSIYDKSDGQDFVLVQRKDGSLIMVAGDKKEKREFKPSWKLIQKASKKFSDAVIFVFPTKPLDTFSEDAMVQDGEIVTRENRNDMPTFKADVKSVPKEHHGCDSRGNIGDVYCYHKMPDGTLYCGHDGCITVWKLK